LHCCRGVVGVLTEGFEARLQKKVGGRYDYA
jgi:hypothetical protein